MYKHYFIKEDSYLLRRRICILYGKWCRGLTQLQGRRNWVGSLPNIWWKFPMPWGPKNLQKIFLSPTNFLLFSQSKMRSDAPAQLHDMSMDIIWLKQAISMTMGSYCVNVLLYLQENRPPCFDSEVFFSMSTYTIFYGCMVQ